MTNKFSVIAAGVLVASLAGCVSTSGGSSGLNEDDAGLDDVEDRQVRMVDDVTSGRFAQRTWVVYESEFGAMTDPHLAFGDAFRLKNRRGSNYVLLPLENLRKRWGMTGSARRNPIRLIESADHKFLCGKFKASSNHEPPGQHHLLLISAARQDNKIALDVEPFVANKSIQDQCNNITHTHRGRAHAEN
jgi:hypothetical protein